MSEPRMTERPTKQDVVEAFEVLAGMEIDCPPRKYFFDIVRNEIAALRADLATARKTESLVKTVMQCSIDARDEIIRGLRERLKEKRK